MENPFSINQQARPASIKVNYLPVISSICDFICDIFSFFGCKMGKQFCTKITISEQKHRKCRRKL